MIPDLFAWTAAALVAHERLDTLPRRRFSLLADLDRAPVKVAKPRHLCRGCGVTHPAAFELHRISQCKRCRFAEMAAKIMAKRSALLEQVRELRK